MSEREYITSMDTVVKSSDSSEDSPIPLIIEDDDEEDSISTLSEKNVETINLQNEILKLKKKVETQKKILQNKETEKKETDDDRRCGRCLSRGGRLLHLS